MKCPICTMIEMRVMANDGETIKYECPGCHEEITMKIKEESAKE